MISVCMATYNGEKFIKEQIDSILCQLNQNDELIISDDGSTDKTIDIINSFDDERIRIFHHIKKTEYGKIKNSRNFFYATDNFENTLKRAKGEYIFLADQDDIWCKNKVEETINYLKEYDLVMSNFSIIDSTDKVIVEKYYQSSPISNSLIMNVVRSHFLGCCMAFKRNVLSYVLPFPQKLIAHDYWIGCLGVNRFKFMFIEEPLHLYRRDSNNVSTSTGHSSNTFLYRAIYRLVFFVKLCVFQRRNRI